MSEFIGSRISLISKSDIRYVGRLHEINSADSTVSLEEVRSFGSEGRRGKPEDEIPPSDQVYEYIVFRGSDVKDLTIVEPPKENQPAPPQMPNDPAILGSTRPPQQSQQQNQQFRGPPPPQQPPYSPFGGYPPQPQQQQQQQPQQSRFAPPGGPHGFPGAPGAVPGYGGMPFGGPPPPGWYPPPGHGFPQGPPGQGPPGQFGPPQNGPGPQMRGGPHGGPSPLNQQPQHQGQNNAQMGGNMPKQSTPSQAPPPPLDTKPTELSATPAPLSATEPAPPLPTGSKPDTGKPQQPEQRPKADTANKNSRVAVPLAGKPAQQPASKGSAASTQQQSRQPSQQTPQQSSQQAPQQAQSAAQAAAAAVAAAMAKLGPSQGNNTQQSHKDGMDNLTEKVQQMRTDERTKHSRAPGTGGYAAGNRGGRGGRRPSTRGGIDVPTTDFDFESSNAKFNKQDLVKEAIATGSPAGTPGEQDGGNPLNGASVHTGAAVDGRADGEDVVIPEAGQKAYNKSSSFFDNISSELKDRNSAQEDGKRVGGREFRSEERNKNFETFGQGSVDSGYRGGFRGRGRGRGFGGRGRGFSGQRGGGYAPRGRGAPAEI